MTSGLRGAGYLLALAAAVPQPANAIQAAAAPFPPLPDATGWGVHVLTAARDPGGALWVGTYGQGMLRPGDVAEAVVFAATRPPHVHVDWLRINPLP